MNLVQLRTDYPHLFKYQDWFRSESFMRVLPNSRYELPPTEITAVGEVPESSKGLPLACELASAFVKSPGAEIWRGYLWCRDRDHLGQRVFVGGVSAENNGRLEIHRHLAINEKWGVARWR